MVAPVKTLNFGICSFKLGPNRLQLNAVVRVYVISVIPTMTRRADAGGRTGRLNSLLLLGLDRLLLWG